MKRFVLFSVLFWLSLFCNAVAQTTYVFSATSNLSLPIKIQVNGRYYQLNSTSDSPKPGSISCITVKVKGEMTWAATDCDNDRITKYERNIVHDNAGKIAYVSIRLFGTTKAHRPSTAVSDGSNVRVEETTVTETPSTQYTWNSSGANALSEAYGRGMDTDYESFPYFSVSGGYSRFASPFVELKYRTSGLCGVSLMAQYGFDKSPEDKILWNVGLGVCFEHFSLNMRFGETYLNINKGITVDAAYDWFFSEHFGISPFVGIALCDIKKHDPDAKFNWGAALIYRF